MITGLDHVVVLVKDIAAGSAAYQTLFARAPAWRSIGDGAEHVLFTLDNMTLELMSPDGDGATAERIRSVLTEQGEGLASICFRTGDAAKMYRRLDRLMLKPEPVTEAESRDVTSGAHLSWKRTRAATDATRGIRMFFLELAQERPRSVATAAPPVTAMDHVVISTADPERAAALYGARLGLDMALDRSHPDWGRLMFFRCGDLIVEVVNRPGKDTDTDRDRIWGLSWRVADIDATRSRLVSSGVDVSDVRPGRKPGTRVLTCATAPAVCRRCWWSGRRETSAVPPLRRRPPSIRCRCSRLAIAEEFLNAFAGVDFGGIDVAFAVEADLMQPVEIARPSGRCGRGGRVPADCCDSECRWSVGVVADIEAALRLVAWRSSSKPPCPASPAGVRCAR